MYIYIYIHVCIHTHIRVQLYVIRDYVTIYPSFSDHPQGVSPYHPQKRNDITKAPMANNWGQPINQPSRDPLPTAGCRGVSVSWPGGSRSKFGAGKSSSLCSSNERRSRARLNLNEDGHIPKRKKKKNNPVNMCKPYDL